ncbi:hypothetical protein ACIQVO_37020 [Streptomyces sp. NPDC101062]|uniref:hypothetical protein n=1 Tax=unclassified Streptomyces TaxID=2593676 RepID=UPI00381C3ACC
MKLGITESTVTIKTLSVNGKRMSKGIYNQLPWRSLLADDDCVMEGRPWGYVVDQKCCHSGRRNPHWHVVHEYEGQLFVWVALKRLQDAPCHLRDGEYEPRSKAGTAFLDACMLETHLGCTDFFQGKVFDRIRDSELSTTIDNIKVSLSCSNDAGRLWRAKKGWGGVEEAEKELKTLYERRGKGAHELYQELVADVTLVKQARTNYATALQMLAGLPQLFLGA